MVDDNEDHHPARPVGNATAYRNRSGAENHGFDMSEEPISISTHHTNFGQRRMSASVKPTLATVPSGIGMASEDFEMGEESQGNANHSEPKLRKSSVNSFRNSLRRGNLFLRRMTLEAVPRIDNYRDIFTSRSPFRPSLDELHDSNPVDKPAEDVTIPEEPWKEKFGMFEGVLVRNCLSIWGVMLFLRISWVVAEAGIWQMFIIVSLSTFITMVTALSMSALSTNGDIGGGGTYYVMARILGPQWGGSIGVIFAIANAINCSLNVVGFVQTIQQIMQVYCGTSCNIVDGDVNDLRIMGTILQILVTALCGIGAKYEAKTQLVLLVILTAALINFVVGSIIGPKNDWDKARGFLGYSGALFRENWDADYSYTDGQEWDFSGVFGIFFPAVIGIFAGANVSENLTDPNGSIPIGTILAIIITSTSYAIIGVICAGTMKRAATGNITDLYTGTFLNCNTTGPNHNCTSGMFYDYQAMTLVSGFAPLNYAGCFAATLSTALSSYISCPKLMQVIADDKIYPNWLMYIFGRGWGRGNEPYLGYAFTFAVSLVFILIANLNTVAMIISDFFLVTFALMNYAVFHVCITKPVGWRPTFKYYNKWLSLFVALLCIAVMFWMGWVIALITCAIVLLCYLFVFYYDPVVNWGSSEQALTYRNALTSIQELVEVQDHVKNYRPQILVMSGQPGWRPALVDFAYLIDRNNAMLVCGHVEKNNLPSRDRQEASKRAYTYLRHSQIKAFYAMVDNMSLRRGVAALLETVGVGKMRPNILLMGYKNDWQTCDRDALEQYFGAVHAAFDQHVGMTILRVKEGLDYEGVWRDVNDEPETLIRSNSSQSFSSAGDISSNPSAPATPALERHLDATTVPDDVGLKKFRKKKQPQRAYKDPVGNDLPRTIVNSITQFQRKQNKGIIDVWWLYDDGGLTLLLPYILSTRSTWATCKLRIFCIASGQEDIEKDREQMAALLDKFRVNYTELVVITDLNDEPKDTTKAWFDNIIRDFTRRDDHSGHYITEAELAALQYKTNRHMRLRELLLMHSGESNFVVMTLPLPRKGSVSGPLYMAWLETLTANMPPFLLVRGNQTSVLTYYS